MVDKTNTPAEGPSRRTERNWLIIVLRGLSAFTFLTAFFVAHGLRWASLLVAMALLLTAIGLRRKAPIVKDSFWTASADFVDGQTKYPGQLSLLPHEIIWVPSEYSRQRGHLERAITVSSSENIRLAKGAGLFDVILDVDELNGQTNRFLTHRGATLRSALQRLNLDGST